MTGKTSHPGRNPTRSPLGLSVSLKTKASLPLWVGLRGCWGYHLGLLIVFSSLFGGGGRRPGGGVKVPGYQWSLPRQGFPLGSAEALNGSYAQNKGEAPAPEDAPPPKQAAGGSFGWVWMAAAEVVPVLGRWFKGGRTGTKTRFEGSPILRQGQQEEKHSKTSGETDSANQSGRRCLTEPCRLQAHKVIRPLVRCTTQEERQIRRGSSVPWFLPLSHSSWPPRCAMQLAHPRVRELQL